MGGKARERAYPDPRRAWRPFRWPVNIDVSLQEHGSCPLNVKMLELSATGCRLLTGYRIRPGSLAVLRIHDFKPIRGTIIWCENWQVALGFDTVLHLAVVRHIAGTSGDGRGIPPSPFASDSPALG